MHVHVLSSNIVHVHVLSSNIVHVHVRSSNIVHVHLLSTNIVHVHVLSSYDHQPLGSMLHVNMDDIQACLLVIHVDTLHRTKRLTSDHQKPSK